MKKRTKIILSLAVAFAVIFGVAVACGVGTKSDGESENLAGQDRAPGYAEGGASSGSLGDNSVTSGSGKIELDDRKIIKNVNETVQTDRYDEFMEALGEAIEELGGFVSNKRTSSAGYGDEESMRSAYIEIRIPQEKLDEFVSGLDAQAVVTNYYESSVDVTGAYIDVESRIAVLEAEEEALIEMLSKSGSVDTALKVRERLLAVQSDLASLRSQKENYDSRVSYSTVYLNVYEVRRAVEREVGFFAEVGGNFRDSLYNIGRGLRAVGVFVIGDFLYILLVITALVGAFLLLRGYRNFRTSRREKEELGENEEKSDSEGEENK